MPFRGLTILHRNIRAIEIGSIDREANGCHHNRIPVENETLVDCCLELLGIGREDRESAFPCGEADVPNVDAFFADEVLEEEAEEGGGNPLPWEGGDGHE